MNHGQYISFKKDEVIHEILDNNSFLNNNDIYSVLECIGRIVEVLVMITGVKKRKELLENIFIDESQQDTVELIYSTLLRWFSKNNWFNSISIKNLDKEIRDEVESERVYDEVNDRIWADEVYQGLIGEFGEWGTIDNVEEMTVEKLETVVKLEDKIILVYDVLLSGQTYLDHEYYDNGSELCFIKITGVMDDDKFVIDKAEYMGVTNGFRAFKFD